jgi:hypothetical protein
MKLWHLVEEETPVFPADIIYLAPNGNFFLYRMDEIGRSDDWRVHWHCIEDGKWCYAKDLLNIE